MIDRQLGQGIDQNPHIGMPQAGVRDDISFTLGTELNSPPLGHPVLIILFQPVRLESHRIFLSPGNLQFPLFPYKQHSIVVGLSSTKHGPSMHVYVRSRRDLQRTTIDDDHPIDYIGLGVIPGPGIHIARYQNLPFGSFQGWDIVGVLAPRIDDYGTGFISRDHFYIFFYDKRTDAERLVWIYRHFDKNIDAVIGWYLQVAYHRALVSIGIDPEYG